MKKSAALLAILSAALVFACQGGQAYHKSDLPDPAAFDADFSELDKNSDGQVNWAEFKRHFPDASPEVFMALDMNDDARVNADEWDKFKDAHGM